MKRRRILLIIVIICAFISCDSEDDKKQPEPTDPPQSITIKMMTYNIYGARATKPSNAADIQALAAVIKAHNPDFVALQEVDVFTDRSGKDVHQARDLAEMTGMKWHFTKAINFGSGEYGDAVLSKHDILETKNYTMSVTEELKGEIRSVCVIKVKVGDKYFFVASTHLDHLGNEANRILQAGELKNIVADIGETLIVGADMNAKPDSNTMNMVRSYLNMGCNASCDFTFPSDAPTRTIDYIMYTPLSKITITNYQVVNDTKASDHRPVVATIEIK